MILSPQPQWDWWFEVEHRPLLNYEFQEKRGEILAHKCPPEGWSQAFLAQNTILLRRRGEKLRYERMSALDEVGRLPSDIARAHLKGAYALWKPRWSDEDLKRMDEQAYPPILALPGHYGDMAYVDIKAAYFSLYSIYWGVEYWPPRWMGGKVVVVRWSKELEEHKLARNTLYGYIRRVRSTIYTASGPVHVNHGGYTYPQVALAVVDVLHGLMAHALQMGAVYVMVDGVIIPQTYVDAFRSLAHEWGLNTEVKAVGDARVWGVGSYSIGNLWSKRILRQEKPFSNIKTHLLEWLEPRHKWRLSLYKRALGM